MGGIKRLNKRNVGLFFSSSRKHARLPTSFCHSSPFFRFLAAGNDTAGPPDLREASFLYGILGNSGLTICGRRRRVRADIATGRELFHGTEECFSL